MLKTDKQQVPESPQKWDYVNQKLGMKLNEDTQDK